MPYSTYQYFIRLIFLIGFFILVFNNSYGQGNLTLNGGNQSISLTTGNAGGQLASVINTTTSLRYKISKTEVRKITVSTSCPGQHYYLSVIATSVTQGSASPERILNNINPAQDLITDTPMKNGNGTATLQYTASATFDQGNSTEQGDDIHTITYTLQVQ